MPAITSSTADCWVHGVDKVSGRLRSAHARSPLRSTQLTTCRRAAPLMDATVVRPLTEPFFADQVPRARRDAPRGRAISATGHHTYAAAERARRGPALSALSDSDSERGDGRIVASTEFDFGV